MKRIVLAAVTCLSLAVAIPAVSAVSAAHSSGHHAGRDQRPDDRGGHGDRRGDRHRDRERRDRLEHFRAQPAGTAGVVRSFQNGVLTITRPDDSTASGTVTGDTRVRCEGMDRDDPSCVAVLHQPGTTVRDAELNVSQGSAIWREIELGA